MSAILFRNATVVDGTQPERRPGMEVLVEGGIIREVSDRPLKPRKADTIDLKGRTLMPGLIDCHMHAIAVQVNLARISERPESLVALEAKELLEAMLQRGFTSVRDAGGADWGLQEAVERDLIKGPRMFIAGRALSQTGGHADARPRTTRVEGCACSLAGAELGRIADGVPEVRRAARDELRKGANHIKIMASGGVASPNDPIWNLQYAEDEVRAAVEEARAWRSYVMAHAYTAAAIRRSIDFGVRTIEHANLIDRATADHATRHGAYVVPTLVTYWALEREAAGLGLPPESVVKIKDVSTVGLEALDHLKQAETKIGFGTDLLGAMQRHQSREFLIRREVCTPFEIIRQATLVNAEIVQRDGKLGVVKPDAIADLIVVDGNPLRDIGLLAAPEKHVTHVMKAGRFYKRAA